MGEVGAKRRVRDYTASLELLVTMHRRFMLGVAHGRVDKQRETDDTAEIVIKPVFVAETLEIQRDRRCGAAEYRHRNGIGQADAERTDFGRKQLCLHDGVDGSIAGDEN